MITEEEIQVWMEMEDEEMLKGVARCHDGQCRWHVEIVDTDDWEEESMKDTLTRVAMDHADQAGHDPMKLTVHVAGCQVGGAAVSPAGAARSGAGGR